jgi:hypothetical protein
VSTALHAPEALGLPLTWVDFDETPIMFGNRFLVQHQPDEFVVSIGQVTSPPFTGTADEIRRQARDLTQVEIATVARIGLTRHRLVELIAMMQATLEEHDRLGTD